MPELPEVEVVRRGLARRVVGRTVQRVDVLHPRPLRRHLLGPRDFAARLAGRTLVDVRRRGKYLWFPLESGDAVVAHLGMSGQLLVRAPSSEAERHLRVRIALPGVDVRFVDQRMFGGLAWSEGGAELPAAIAHIARDPLDPAFDDDELVRRVRRRHTGLKRALLDQTLLSGVGNIYADEALWLARLHYARPTETLRRFEIVGLLAAVRQVMVSALHEGGTSFDALFVDVNGDGGYFGRSLQAYGRAGQPCPRCGTPILREAFGNRSSFRCPRCQPKPRRARW